MRVRTGKSFFLFLNQNICWVTQKNRRDGSFDHPKHMLKLMGKEINVILSAQLPLSGPM